MADRIRLIAVALLGLFTASTCLALGKPKISDCYDSSNENAAKVCRNVVVATYQAMQVAQVEHGMTLKTCQFGVDDGVDELMERFRPNFFDMPDSVMDFPVVALTIATLEASSKCQSGLSSRVGGLSAGEFVQACTIEMKQAGPAFACFAYAAGMRDTLNTLSGENGTDKLFCLPNGKIDLKQALRLFIDENKRDFEKTKFRPAASVMVDALARKYPCK